MAVYSLQVIPPHYCGSAPKNQTFFILKHPTMKSPLFLGLLLVASLSLQAQSEETLFNSTNLRLSGIWGSATYNFSSFNNDDWTLIRGGYGA